MLRFACEVKICINPSKSLSVCPENTVTNASFSSPRLIVKEVVDTYVAVIYGISSHITPQMQRETTTLATRLQSRTIEQELFRITYCQFVNMSYLSCRKHLAEKESCSLNLIHESMNSYLMDSHGCFSWVSKHYRSAKHFSPQQSTRQRQRSDIER